MEKLYSKPKVSIITCVYNGEKYISKLLDSVLNMGYPNIEHIIVDDGSNDSTKDIVMKYAYFYRSKENASLRIIYIKQENMGLGGATNTGLKAVTGDYWTWINCDDWYVDDGFTEHIYFLEKNKNYDVAVMNGVWHDQKTGADWNIFSSRAKAKGTMYNNKKSVVKRFSFFGDRGRQTLYVVRTSSYRKLVPCCKIYPSRYNQDTQLTCQVMFFLKCHYIEKMAFMLLIREDSLLQSYSNYNNPRGVNEAASNVSILYIDNNKKYTYFYTYAIMSKLFRLKWIYYREKKPENILHINKKIRLAKKYIRKHKGRYYYPIKIRLKMVIANLYLLSHFK